MQSCSWIVKIDLLIVLHVWVRKNKRRNIYKNKGWHSAFLKAFFTNRWSAPVPLITPWLRASQNARSCGQTINHRALRICKKRIQKVLMLSSFFLINSSSYLLSDSYNGTLFKSLHSVYVKRYWLIRFNIHVHLNFSIL